MKNIIVNELKKIEQENDVKILYACESGSRAWGFPSKDSDYDVRFIYVHKPDYYLTIDPIGMGKKRDVIELPINDLLDISGWDLTKTLRLFRKSNPSLLEWMRSTILYYKRYTTLDNMRQMENNLFSPKSSLYHYLNMAKGNYREMMQSDTVKIKKYFYILRPILACMWIENHHAIPPISFHELVNEFIRSGKLRNAIDTLLEKKLAGDERDAESKITVITDFLGNQIHHFEQYIKNVPREIHNPTEQLDMLFRETLREVWE